MRALAPLLFGLATMAAALPAPARADEVARRDMLLVTPVFSQLVAMPWPAGFRSGYERSNGQNYIHELIPKDDTVQDWRQIVTLTGQRGAVVDKAQTDPKAAALALADSLAVRYQAACPESFGATTLGTPEIRGARATFAAYLACGSVPGADRSEAMVFVVMVGAQDIYSLQWAEHGPATAKAPALDRAHWGPRIAVLIAGARLCPFKEGERAPYPSCLDN